MRFYNTKKDLLETIKAQNKVIDNLNEGFMKQNIVIRNEKPIRIDNCGLDYMVDLEQKYYNLQSIVKEVREYCDFGIENWITDDGFVEEVLGDVKKILDKVDKEKSDE